MKYFLDSEFIEDFTKPLINKRRHYIDLISIGIVSEDGREYYAVSNEFDVDYVWNKFQWKGSNSPIPGNPTITKEKEYWLRDNVLMPIWTEHYIDVFGANMPQFTLRGFKHLIRTVGKSNNQIAFEILRFIYDPGDSGWGKWLGSSDEYFKALSDIKDSEYDPQFYGYYADYDWVLFCSLFGRMLDLPKGFPMYCRDLKQVMDEKAEKLSPLRFNTNLMMIKQKPAYPMQSNAHNALDDARWNKKLYDFLQTF